MSHNKIHCFSLTRIQVAEGQAGPNTSCTFSNHEGQGEGPNQIPRERGPVEGWGDAAGQYLDVEQEGVGTNHRAQ